MMGASHSASMASVSALPLPEPLGNQGWPLSAATGKSSDAPQAPKRPRFLRTHDKHIDRGSYTGVWPSLLTMLVQGGKRPANLYKFPPSLLKLPPNNDNSVAEHR